MTKSHCPSSSMTGRRTLFPSSVRTGIRLLSVSLVALPVISCQQKDSKTVSPPKDSLVISLPKPTPISETEKRNFEKSAGQWYDSLLKNGSFNGGVLVAKGGNIVFEKYQGSARLDGKESIGSQTPFHIASVSKTMTAMAVLKFCQEGKISLEDEFSRYFAGFPYPGVTIKTLLNHRSGIPNYVYFMEELGWDKSTYIRNQDILDALVNRKAEIKNIAPADTRFSYCNTNYALLALLIEKISGKSFPDFMRDEYFKPIGMTNSFVFTRADSARVPMSYDWRGNLIPMNFLDLVYGDKNIYSTPQDLLKWDRALKANVIFKEDWLAKAYTPYSNEKPGIRNYGLGWRLNVYPNGSKITYHNGWWHGNNASFIRLIPEDATIIVLGNRFTRAVYKAKYLCSLFIDSLELDREDEADSNRVPGGGSRR